MNEVEQAIYRMTEFAVDVEKLANDTSRLPAERESSQVYYKAFLVALTALHEKLARERGWGCAYCVIGKRSPDAEYCSNCGRKLTPALPELANESEEVNHEPKLASETAENCTVTQKQSPNCVKVKYFLRCDYCGRFTNVNDLTDYWVRDKYFMCQRCKEKRNV